MENETMESGKAESSNSETAPDEQDGHPSQEASSLHALASYRLCALGFKDLQIFKNKPGIDARIEEHIVVGIEHLGSGFYAFGRSKLEFREQDRMQKATIRRQNNPEKGKQII